MFKIDFLENAIKKIKKNSIVPIVTIIVSSLLLRLYFFPFGIPLTHDAVNYFWYASDINILGRLPNGYTFGNNGWPVFLAPFFTMLKSNNMILHMELQRTISVLISVLTIIPVYFLCKRFVDYKFAIIGAIIFAFEPRLIQDSLTGLNSSMYIALETLALVLFFSSNKYAKYYSFALIGFASIVRSEGLFLFFALSIIYFFNNRKNKREIIKYAILFLIFFIVITPMVILKIQVNGNDGLSSRIIGTTSEILENNSTGNQGIFDYIANGSITFVKFFGWDMIPIFIFFVPIGIFLFFRNRSDEKTTIIVTSIIISIPILYAYSAQALDTKYFYPLYPIFCIISAIAMKKFSEYIRRPDFFIIIVIIGIFVLSFIFLNFKLIDLEHDREYYLVTQYVINNTRGINDYYPEAGYLLPVEMEMKWPILKSDFVKHIIVSDTGEFNSMKYDSVYEYIKTEKNNGLSHIITDNNPNRPLFLKDVFLHEEKYPYLLKQFDSKNHGFIHEIKIFRINYEIFDPNP